MIQRRKTIHDIVDFDSLITHTPIQLEQQQTKTDQADLVSSLVLPSNTNSADLITPKSFNSDSASLLSNLNRILVKHGHVQLFNVNIILN